MGNCAIALIGLAVMGQNLALNIAGKGHRIAVYNRTAEKTKTFMAERVGGLPVIATYSLANLVKSLQRPRKILLMVQAGKAVDELLLELGPLLAHGDILLDGGNSLFTDTRRRYAAMQEQGLHFMGVGISGGEEGALNGPSIMPGGDPEAYTAVAPILTSIAAQAGGRPCCSLVGSDGAGHYVKMIHNGIEYGDMQLIAEAYSVMKHLLGMNAEEAQAAFAEWNSGELESYLIEITAEILQRQDELTGLPVVDIILDKAGQKGTGRWVSQNALELGVPVSTITEAVFSRCMSGYKDERVAASAILQGPESRWRGNRAEFLGQLRDALYAAKICSYAQGFGLMKAAAAAYGWSLDYGEIALLWRSGCIIRARFLDRIQEAYTENQDLANLLVAPFFSDVLNRTQTGWRKVIGASLAAGVPIPALSASLAYYDSYRSPVLSANLIQAQRDYFGAHTYARVDRPGVFHTEWMKK